MIRFMQWEDHSAVGWRMDYSEPEWQQEGQDRGRYYNPAALVGVLQGNTTNGVEIYEEIYREISYII